MKSKEGIYSSDSLKRFIRYKNSCFEFAVSKSSFNESKHLLKIANFQVWTGSHKLISKGFQPKPFCTWTRLHILPRRNKWGDSKPKTYMKNLMGKLKINRRISDAYLTESLRKGKLKVYYRKSQLLKLFVLREDLISKRNFEVKNSFKVDGNSV